MTHESLNSIALKYGTDKASNLHNYTRWYDKHLPSPDSDMKLLEIGVDQGKSLKMWREYYTKAHIFGLDINDCQPVEGTVIWKGDQKNFLDRNVIPNFDVIIDDGSHLWDDQIVSFKRLWQHVNPGGVYVIEDLHTSFLMAFGEPGGLNTTTFLHLLMDDVGMYGAGGLGDVRNCIGYSDDLLNDYQRTVESMTFYPSICFIRKALR